MSRNKLSLIPPYYKMDIDLYLSPVTFDLRLFDSTIDHFTTEVKTTVFVLGLERLGGGGKHFPFHCT